MKDETPLHYFLQDRDILPNDAMWTHTTSDTPNSNEVLFDLIKAKHDGYAIQWRRIYNASPRTWMKKVTDEWNTADYEYRLKPRKKTQKEKVMEVINNECDWGTLQDDYAEAVYTALKPYLK